MRKTSTYSKCANGGVPFLIIKYLFLSILCKTLLFECQKCANGEVPFLITKHLFLRGLDIFYVPNISKTVFIKNQLQLVTTTKATA